MGVLGYTAEQYDQISNAITGMYQTVSGGNSQFADFAHMQYALSARLAYTLKEEGIDLDGMLAVVPEDASYCGGWLGDAVISDVGGTTLKNDDYCADLDAENIFRDIAEGEKTFIEAANDYYNGLTENRTRADIFLEHIPYFTVQSKVFSYLGLISSTEANMNTLRNSYPDTYNFLLSLQNGLATMGTFA